MPTPEKPTAEQLAAAADSQIPDVIGPGLKLLFVGINPSLYSAATGHHFARPGNRFWPALHQSGITDKQLAPWEDRALLDYDCGITNMVARATRRADELSVKEIVAGSEELVAKVTHYSINKVVFLGITAYRQAFALPKAKIGEQEDRICDRPVWVLPNPSGLNAHYQAKDFAQLFRAVAYPSDSS